MHVHSIDDMYKVLRSLKAFDDKYYLDENKDILAAGIDPLRHYLEFGSLQNRSPTHYFSPALYLEENPDVARANVEPFFHFIAQGIHEGRRVPTAKAPASRRMPEQPPAARFDAAWYLEVNRDVAAAGTDPERHYAQSGEGEGRRPNALFDPRYYAQVNPDVAATGMGLFEHYRTVGWREGRSATNPSLDWRSHKTDRNILFIGHDAIQAGAQTVLLDTVRWFAEHTDYNVTVLLCDVGQLIGDYARYADVFVFQNYSFSLDERVAPLLNVRWAFVYANTVRSGTAARQFTDALRLKAPLIAHLHERETVLLGFEGELRDLVAAADRFIVVDQQIGATLRERFDVPASSVIVEHPFIRSRLEGPADEEGAAAIRAAVRGELGVADGAVLVMGCGTAYERKGVDLFVETALSLVVQYPPGSLCFAWIGEGADLAASRRRVGEAGAERAFRFTGHRPDAALLLGGADLFFLSSREDPFPLVCLEAAQYGVPVVHFDRGTGIGAFVRADRADEAAGAVVPAFSAWDAAEGIARLIDDPALRIAMGARARARLFAGFEAGAKLARLCRILTGLGYIRPSVSVIVPNYNHAPYLDARLQTVLNQTLKSLQVIVLDDCSTDRSREVIGRYLADPRVSFHPNAANSGSPFSQWAKGIALAEADIVWIAESDDLADLDFCRNLVGAFADPMVAIATGRTLIVHNELVVPGALDPWYDGAETGLFKSSWKRDGIDFIRSHFGMKCSLVNASAMLLRKAVLVESLEGVGAYRMCGDWLVYLRMLKGGKIAFSEAAVSYFRRHDRSAVHVIEGTPTYFRERAAIAGWVVDNAHPSPVEVRRLLAELRVEWERFAWKNPDDALDRYVDAPDLLRRACRRRGTVALYVHGMLFSKGGIERLGAQLANTLVGCGYDVVLYCDERGGPGPVYPLLEAVRVVGISLAGDRAVDRVSDRLRRDGVDLFVPMLSEWLFEPAIRAGTKAGVRILASEHNDPWKIEELWWSREARALALAGADRIHLLLPDYVRSLAEPLRARAVVIPNGVERSAAGSVPSTCLSHQIICVARFAPQKRLDLLLEAFAVVAPARPGWTLMLLGEGDLDADLRALVETLGLAGRVAMPGTSDRVAAMLAQSSIFVLPSAFEGFPIVVLEAQRAGLPCVAFRSCNGANALIGDGLDGLLVEPFEAPALAGALLHLIDDPALRQRMGKAALAKVAPYRLDLVMKKWVETIDDLMEDA